MPDDADKLPEDIATAAPDASIAGRQAALSALVLLVFLLLIGVAQIAIANDRLLIPSRMALWKNSTGTFVDRGFYSGEAEKLLFGVLPSADFSRGGIYFTGASLTKRSLTIWDWPVQDRARVHNYCVPAATDSEQAQFTRYLIDYEGLLKAGGKKNAIFTELGFGSASQSESAEFQHQDQAWRSWFQRDGLYQYDRQTGIRPVASPVLLRSWRITQLNANEFWNWSLQFAHLAMPGEIVAPAWKVDGDHARAYWADRLGPNWESSMDEQIRQYAQLIDYLHARQVRVVAIYFPQPSWFDHFAPAVAYRQKVLPMLASKSVEVVDLMRLLDDSCFADSHHLSYQGTQKIQPYFIAVAERYLRMIDSDAN